MVSHPRDFELVQRCLAGDDASRAALGERFRCIRRIVAARNRRSAMPLPGDHLDDVAGEASLAAWHKLSEYSGYSTLESWLFRFCEYTLWNHRRRRRKHRFQAHNPDPVDSRVPERDPDTEALYRALAALTPQERAIVDAKHFGSLTFEQVAAQFDMPLATAKGRYYRVMARLRHLLDDRGAGA